MSPPINEASGTQSSDFSEGSGSYGRGHRVRDG